MVKIQEKPILQAKKSDMEMMLVNPDHAIAWLEYSKFQNRKISERMVAKIASDIQKNHWRFDGNSLKFDKEGNLIDGQHRLWAIVKSQRCVLCLVIRNLDHNVVNVIDTGRSRTYGDILHFHGHVNSNALSNACRLLLGFKEHSGNLYDWARFRDRKMFSPSDVVKECEENAEIVNSLQTLVSYKFTKKFMGLGTAALCHYLFAQRDRLMADEFFYLLEKGVNLDEGHAVLALKNCLTLRDHLTIQTAKGGYHRTAYLIALVIKAWNAYREERPVKRLTYGVDKESYPVAI